MKILCRILLEKRNTDSMMLQTFPLIITSNLKLQGKFALVFLDTTIKIAALNLSYVKALQMAQHKNCDGLYAESAPLDTSIEEFFRTMIECKSRGDKKLLFLQSDQIPV